MNKLAGKKILIVDDEILILEILEELLMTYGVEIHTATNGLEAFEKIKTSKLDLVISDIRMPQCSGIELLELINDYEGHSPNVILMTAFDDINAQRASEMGAKGLYLKPQVIENILEVIQDSLP